METKLSFGDLKRIAESNISEFTDLEDCDLR